MYYKWLKKTIKYYSEELSSPTSSDIQAEIIERFEPPQTRLQRFLADPNQDKLDKKHWALYYYYLQKAGVEPQFANKKKKETYIRLCKDNPEFGNVTNFQKFLNMYAINKNRLIEQELDTIRCVAIMVSDYEAAENLAKEDIAKILTQGKYNKHK